MERRSPAARVAPVMRGRVPTAPAGLRRTTPAPAVPVPAALAVLLLVAALAACATGEPIDEPDFTLTVGEEAVAVASPMLRSGMNYGNWMIVYQLLDRYEPLDIPLLRYPAGNYGDDNLLTGHALERFVRSADWLDAEPMVQHNLLMGDPEEAARWVRFAQEEELRIGYWFIGNEPDRYAIRGQPQWTPEYYAEMFREYAAAIRAVDPEARIVGPAVTGTPNLEWMEAFLRGAGDVVDVLAWQWYPTDGTADRDEALASAVEVREHIELFRSLAGDPEYNPDGWEREIPMFISEFGLSWRTSHGRLLTDMTAAIWLAEVWAEMVIAELEYAAYFALQGTGGHGLFDSGHFVRPTYFATRFVAEMPERWHPVEIDAPRADLVAYAARGEGGTTELLLLNKREEPVTVAIPEARGTVRAQSVSDAEQDEPVETRFRGGVELPPYSITRAVY